MGLLVTKINAKILRLTLNRAEAGNSLTYKLVKELRDAFSAAEKNRCSVIVLEGAGKNFCTGADLSWMLNASKLTVSANRRDMKGIAEMYKAISRFSGILIVKAQGKVLGGGVGLVASADIVYCETNTIFALPEVSLNITPGIITPAVIHRINSKNFLQLAVTGKAISAKKAVQIGLADYLYKSKILERKFEAAIQHLSKKDPDIIREIKRMANLVNPMDTKPLGLFCDINANLRVKQEFISAAQKLIK